MPRNSPSNHDPNLKSKFPSTNRLQRRGIHDDNNQDNGIENYDENEIDSPQSEPDKKTLYPDLKDDLAEIKRQNNFSHEKNKSQKRKEAKKPSKTENQEHETAGFSFQKYFTLLKEYIIYILALLLALVLSQPFYRFFSSQPVHPVTDVSSLIQDMQNHFHEQRADTFKVLKLALEKVVNVELEPEAPAIVTILANKEAENRASDFCHYVAEALAPSKYVSFNESVQRTYDPHDLKFKIDEEIKSRLGDGKLNVVIVDKLHHIPFKAALIFHGYCDHESAQFKRAVYLFIVHLKRSLPEDAKWKDLDKAAMEGLRNIWPSASDDEVDSLITRMTVNVINIR